MGVPRRLYHLKLDNDGRKRQEIKKSTNRRCGFSIQSNLNYWPLSSATAFFSLSPCRVHTFALILNSPQRSSLQSATAMSTKTHPSWQKQPFDNSQLINDWRKVYTLNPLVLLKESRKLDICTQPRSQDPYPGLGVKVLGTRLICTTTMKNNK